MGLFTARCPVGDRERTWIQESLEWLHGQFGDGPLTAPVTEPTREYFPPPFGGSDDDVRALVTKMAGYMGARPDVGVEFSDNFDHAALMHGIAGGASRITGAAGLYTAERNGRPVITIDRSGVHQPARLLAVIAHELGHVRLLGEGRVAPGRQDGEPLTDLVTVYLGMGILTANAAFDFSQTTGYRTYGWQARRLGYMTEQMFGYALACYSAMRGEPDPAWAGYLDTNPRVYLKHGLRYLRHEMPGGAPWPRSPAAASPARER